MCLSVCMFSVYADNDDANQPADPGSQGGEVIDDQGGGNSDVPVNPDPQSDPASDDGSSDVPYIPDDGSSSNNDGGGGGGYDDGGQSSYDNGGDDSNSNGNVYYDGDGNSYSNQEDVYVGGGQNYDPPASTAPPAALYKTEKKIDVNELSKNDWGDIANMLKKTDSSESDGDDFAFIQKNTKGGDNGNWIIIVGVLLIGLSVAGFIYLIASNINRRKKIKAGNITKNTPQPRSAAASTRAGDDYNDGYGTTAKQSTKQPEKTNSTGHYGSGKSGKGGKRYR